MAMSIEQPASLRAKFGEQARKDFDVQRLQVALTHARQRLQDAGLDGVGGVVVGPKSWNDTAPAASR